MFVGFCWRLIGVGLASSLQCPPRPCGVCYLSVGLSTSMWEVGGLVLAGFVGVALVVVMKAEYANTHFVMFPILGPHYFHTIHHPNVARNEFHLPTSLRRREGEQPGGCAESMGGTVTSFANCGNSE